METKRPPRVSDPETSRAVSQIYDDLNAIADAIGTGQGRTHREGSSTEGEVGDIKIGRAGLGKYAVMAKTEDGWVESDELPFRDERKKKGSSSGGTGDGITESSLGANGYVKFRNGFTIQWGAGSYDIDADYTHSFEISFPTACFSVQINHKISGSSGTGAKKGYPINAHTFNTTGFTMNRHDDASDTINYDFIAIGY